MRHQNQTTFDLLKILNLVFISVSVALCGMLLLADIPGIELLETNPNWLLIWLVAWSVRQTIWQGAIAGVIIGALYDGIIMSVPSHIPSFILVGVLTASLQKQKYLGEDFISVAFLVFFMTILSEALFAWQYFREYDLPAGEVLLKFQQVAIVTAIISSLWSPAFYYPFNLWQQNLQQWQKKFKP